ncbi:MAG: TlpA disulfide reductase family protein [Mobilicoccus sp.]|nr:TlpA disulfide reductase family protein [Mobilicoccus sp.]
MRRRLWPVAAALLLLLAACSAPSPYPREAPELSGSDLDGASRSLADLRGQVVLVNVWASWCGPCRDEIPVLQEASEEFGEGLAVLGINMRDRDRAARDLLTEFGADYPNIVDPDGTLSVEWGVVGIPMTFVVDAQGQLVDRHAGPVTAEWIDEAVAPRVGS